MRTKPLAKTFTYLILILVTISLIFPFLWLFLTSIKSEVQLFSVPIKFLPHPFTMENYIKIFQNKSVFRYLLNSVFISVVTTAVSLIVSIPAAYSIAKYRFKFGNILLLLILFIRMVPGITQLLPYYYIISKFGFSNTYAGLILIYIPGNCIFLIMMLQNFFQAFPKDIEEAGEIDGLSPVGIIIRILIPVSLPAISSVTIINFMGTWNEFMYASIILRNPQLATFPIIIAQKVNAFSTYWGELTSYTVVYVLPVILFTLFAQKGLVQGLTAGAVKE
jgi:multiple sugar transport system permease protein